MVDLLPLRRAGWGALLPALWLVVSVPAWAEASHPRSVTPVWQPVFQPYSWHREHWRQRRRHDPSFIIPFPESFLDAYVPWGPPAQPDVPPRPEPVLPRERGEMWRDDVVGAGSGGRIEEHPEGRILRSRPRSD
ncbi:hypothetical protein ACOJCM_03605 [Billgrantia sp. LNSP4103-1]|uniref:hypothetical protein n=1 Tax=Billgrantia sp. LNSP4103-1 TaxID=3410266 RepID=UPI00403F10EB